MHKRKSEKLKNILNQNEARKKDLIFSMNSLIFLQNQAFLSLFSVAEKAKGKQDQQRLDGVQGQKLKGTNLIREMEKSMLEFLGIVKVSEPMLT